MDLAPQRFQRCHPAAERQLRLHHLAAAPPAQAHHRQLLLGDGRVRAVQRRFRDLRVGDGKHGLAPFAPDEQRRVRAPDVAHAGLLPGPREQRGAVRESRPMIEGLGLIEDPLRVAWRRRRWSVEETAVARPEPCRKRQRARADEGDERAGDPDRQQAHSAGAPPATSSSSLSLSSTLFLARSKFRLQLTSTSCAVFAAMPRSTSEESALLPWTNAWSATLA